jgi:GR25 family glycosyltransferase involved in LPS biosynthesis
MAIKDKQMPDQTPLIVILEDDARRQSEMSAVVHACYPHANLIIFDDAHKAIAYFANSNSRTGIEF